MTFQDWGIPTPTALRLLQPRCHQLQLIASGGVRNGVDMVKAVDKTMVIGEIRLMRKTGGRSGVYRRA